MIYDCFPFFNELELLEIRLHELGDVVDRVDAGLLQRQPGQDALIELPGGDLHREAGLERTSLLCCGAGMGLPLLLLAW